jgi:hypothetical protein
MWAGYWGLFYRKYMWDFVDGTLRDPGGLQYVSAPVVHLATHSPSSQAEQGGNAINQRHRQGPRPANNAHRSGRLHSQSRTPRPNPQEDLPLSQLGRAPGPTHRPGYGRDLGVPGALYTSRHGY